jgi:hypothetical protein
MTGRKMRDWFASWAPHFGSGIIARPALALMFSGAYVFMTVQGIDPGDAYVAITTAVVLYFFKSHDEEASQAHLKARDDELIELAKHLPPPS